MITLEQVKAKIHTVSPDIQRQVIELMPIAFPELLNEPMPLDPKWSRENVLTFTGGNRSRIGQH